MQSLLSVAIAGCGVAGLAVAILLARQGVRVVIFDKLTTPQPLGSGLILQPTGLFVLDALGLGDEIRTLGAPIRRLLGRTATGRVVLDVAYAALGRPEAAGLAVHRGALFGVLYRAALAAGVAVEPGREVISARDGRLAFSDGRSSARFDLVVDAMGVRSPLSRPPRSPLPFGALWTSLPWDDGFAADRLEQRYEHALRMVGVMPMGRLAAGAPPMAAFFWSLRHIDRPAFERGGLDAWKAQVLALWPQCARLMDSVTNAEQLVFASYAHRTLGSAIGVAAGGKLVHVGDSWHCASPQLGQGANMALLDALALARALASRLSLDDALAVYARSRAQHVRFYQAVTWLFTPAYQSESRLVSWARDWLLAPASQVWPLPPLLGRLVAGELAAPLSAIRRIGPASAHLSRHAQAS